jgi:uncharacterized protein YjbJ (UPF0337 family)
MQAPVERTLHAKATVVPGTESASSSKQPGGAMNEDELKGKAKEIKGKAKDALGGLTDDPEMQVEGKIDEATGRIQNALGKAERKLDDEEDDR